MSTNEMASYTVCGIKYTVQQFLAFFGHLTPSLQSILFNTQIYSETLLDMIIDITVNIGCNMHSRHIICFINTK